MKHLLIVIIIVFSFDRAFAYVPDHAKTNQANELAECAAFYLYGADGARRYGDQQLSDRLTQSANIAMSISEELSNTEVLQARLEMAAEEQNKLISNDLSNISILLHKYKNICTSALGNPDVRYQYWLDK